MHTLGVVTNLLHAFKVLQKHFYELADEYNLAPAQLGALEKLWHQDGLTITELGDKLNLKTSTVTALADRMERDGLLQRKRNDEDRRVVRIYLTEKSRSLKGKIPDFEQYIMDQLLKGITSQEIKTLNTLLQKFQDTLE